MITLKLLILSNPWILSDQGDVLSYERTPSLFSFRDSDWQRHYGDN
jgi:hypothetical protein